MIFSSIYFFTTKIAKRLGEAQIEVITMGIDNKKRRALADDIGLKGDSVVFIN